jgi:GPH family glycoside/pentoside/hexuronide:cation symporter
VGIFALETQPIPPWSGSYHLIICFQILFAAMIADLFEQAEPKTGHRSEGVPFSALTFVRKSVQGLGLLTASFVFVLAE